MLPLLNSSFLHSKFEILHSWLRPALFFLDIVRHAQAVAGGGVHLLGSVDRVLKFGDPVLHLRQLVLDLILELVDLLLGDLKRRLVKLPLLIRNDWHAAASSKL